MTEENPIKAQYNEQTEPQGLAVEKQENFNDLFIPSDKVWHMDLAKDYPLHFQLELPGEYLYKKNKLFM